MSDMQGLNVDQVRQYGTQLAQNQAEEIKNKVTALKGQFTELHWVGADKGLFEGRFDSEVVAVMNQLVGNMQKLGGDIVAQANEQEQASSK